MALLDDKVRSEVEERFRELDGPVKIINFAFPWMLAIVLTMLISMQIGYRLTRVKGAILLVLYVAYIASAVKWLY